MRVAAGERLRIHPVSPDLMAGLWALCDGDVGEYLSVQRSRLHLRRTALRNGDTMVSNRDRPLLTWIDGPAHDAQTALSTACDDERWDRHGHYKPGRCEDRFRDAIGYGLFGPSKAPCPLPLFAGDDNDLDTMAWLPAHSPDAHVVLRAETDLIVLVSAHPRNGLPMGKAPLSRQVPVVQIPWFTHGHDSLTRPDKLSDPAAIVLTSCISSSRAETQNALDPCHD
jgi:uncharacterized protein YcgI (DUF1989 family)